MKLLASITIIISTFLLIKVPSVLAQSQISNPLDGTFIELYSEAYTGIDLANLQPYLEELNMLNLKTLVIMDLARKDPTKSCKDAGLIWVEKYQEKLQLIFNFAKDHNMTIYVGLVSSWSACPTAYSPDNNLLSFLSNTTSPDNPITYVSNTYGNHQSFGGWYIPDEPYLGSWSDPSVGNDYWRGYANAIKQQSDKPIIVAPPLYEAYKTYTPAQIAQRALDFKNNTGIQIQAWQDSVNATGHPFKATSLAQYHVGDYLQAISGAIGRESLWADIETSTCCIANQGGIDGGGYNGVMGARLKNQLDTAPTSIVSQRISWIAQYSLSSVNPRGRYGSSRASRAYHALTSPTKQSMLIKPSSYTWTTTPLAQHPDSSNKMFDHITGMTLRNNPDNYLDTAYVGFNGSAQLDMVFNQSITVNDVGVHLLNVESKNITFPQKLSISCSQDSITYSQPIDFTHTFSTKNISELVLGTDKSEVKISCRYMRLILTNQADKKTFISEVEIVGSLERRYDNPVLIPGDLNGDNSVNIFDFSLLVSKFGNPYTIFDFTTLIANFSKAH